MDLNLLVTWDALLKEGSVQGAADRLGVSQPAVSRALGRLRLTTGDDLLVRAGRAMVPTPYAEQVRNQVSQIAEDAMRLLSPPPRLDLATMDRTFVICAHDAITGHLSTTLIKHVRKQAPLASLAFIAEPSRDTDLLRAGAVDLALDSGSPTGTGMFSKQIATATPQLLARRDHPALDDVAEHAAALGELQFVTLSRRGQLFGRFDQQLLQDGLQRRVIASLPTVSAVIDTVAATDLVAVMPPEICSRAMARNNVIACPLPVAADSVPVVMSWHHRTDTDPAHRWLRTLVERSWKPVHLSSRARKGTKQPATPSRQTAAKRAR